MAVVEARGLSREYRTGEVTVQALREVDLDIDDGEVIVLLGPSGSGKTTLLNLLGGLDSPTAGDIVIDGKAIGGYDARQLRWRSRRRSRRFARGPVAGSATGVGGPTAKGRVVRAVLAGPPQRRRCRPGPRRRARAERIARRGGRRRRWRR